MLRNDPLNSNFFCLEESQETFLLLLCIEHDRVRGTEQQRNISMRSWKKRGKKKKCMEKVATAIILVGTAKSQVYPKKVGFC